MNKSSKGVNWQTHQWKCGNKSNKNYIFGSYSSLKQLYVQLEALSSNKLASQTSIKFFDTDVSIQNNKLVTKFYPKNTDITSFI